MPSKSRAPKAATSGSASPTPPGAIPSGGFITDKQAAEAGLNPETAGQVVADAGAVYAQVQAAPYITRQELVRWATSTWGTVGSVDRLNAAITFLQGAKKLLSLG